LCVGYLFQIPVFEFWLRASDSKSWVLGFGFRDSGFRFRVEGVGRRGTAPRLGRLGPGPQAALTAWFIVQVSGFSVENSGFKVQGSGVRGWDAGFMV
jgi:hypothetical protein